MPASRLLSTGRAARPRIRPAAPAEANRLTPYCRTESRVIKAAATVTIASRVLRDPLQDPHLRTCLRARQVVLDVGAEAAQVDLHADVERDGRSPTNRDHKATSSARPIAVVTVPRKAAPAVRCRQR